MSAVTLLALDTTSPQCSVALLHQDTLEMLSETAPRQHHQKVFSMINILLKKRGITLQEIDALAFNAGPGPFTGIRVGAAITQGLCFALSKPAIPVSSLRALAYHAFVSKQYTHTITAIDAALGETYWALFSVDSQTHFPCQRAPESLSSPSEVTIPESLKELNWIAIGNAWEHHASSMPYIATIDNNIRCSAQPLVQLAEQDFRNGHTVLARNALPIYLRHNVATPKKSTPLH